MIARIRQSLLALGDLWRRYAIVWKHVWSQRHSLESRKRNPAEAEFLPAALSLQETPLSPVPRLTIWLIILFALLTVLWATFGKIDIVATAHGKIVPSDRTKVIQPFETSIIKKIHVTDGQLVKAGQLLVELDGRSAIAEADRLGSDRAAAEMQAARARALLVAIHTAKAPSMQAPKGIDPNHVEEAQRLLAGQYAEYRAKLAGVEAEIAGREAELNSAVAMVHKLELTLPIVSRRAQDFKRLVDANFMSQHGYLEREQALIEQEGDLANLRSRCKEVKASLAAAEYQKRSMVAETVRSALESRSDALQRIASLEQEHIKADSRVQSMSLTSPVNGIVQQLTVHTVGGVVTPAQTLMVIVPRDHALEVEAFLENKDVGFVKAGQHAAVKVETFEYTKYGVVDSIVNSVSKDAINDEKRGLVYSMRVRMSRSNIQVDGREVNLSPGMAVTVEIKTGKRRVLEYFLSPLLQHVDESLKER